VRGEKKKKCWERDMLVVEKEARETLSSKRIWHFRKHQDSFSDMTEKNQGSYWYLFKRWDFKVAIEEGMRETAKKGLWRWEEVSQDRRKASLWQMCFVLFFLLLFSSLQQILSLYGIYYYQAMINPCSKKYHWTMEHKFSL